MIRRIFHVALFMIVCQIATAQNSQQFFPNNKLMTIGTFYFPEHWPEAQWDRDFSKMAEMGFEYVHMAEFSWAMLEPEEGNYNFDWLDKAVELAAKHGLKVMLCTPTATTPVWMGVKYPETYVMYSNYQRGEHGSRQNNSLANPKFRELASKMVGEMAKHYGQNKAIWGWQLDNEPEAKEDFSPSTQEAFRGWLQVKYKTIHDLNLAWGAAFWSITYNGFEEINIHNANKVGWWGSNQHALLDFKRFTASVQADFLNEQATILRKHITPNQFITTNYAALPSGADPRLSTKLDFPAYTAYPNGGSSNLGDQGFRLGDPDKILMFNDYYRPIANGIFGVMELQPGQVNWGNPNALLLPGTVRMWLWQCFAAGADFASSYRYRQILYGVEQYHAAMIKNDGVTPSQGGEEYMKFIKEIRKLEKQNVDNVIPEHYSKMATAILWSHENMWDQNRQSQNGNWNITNYVMSFHKALKSLGAPVDYISETDDFAKYTLLVVPAYQAVDSALVEKWKAYAEQGGNLVVTCRTASKDRDGHFWEAGWNAPLYDLIGASVKNYDMLPGYKAAKVTMDNKEYDWNKWGELLIPEKEEYIKAKYADQFYVGTTAVVSRKLGKGTVTYIGVATNTAEMEKEIVRQLFENKNIRTQNYPNGVFVNYNKGFGVAVNYNSENKNIELPQGAQLIIGETNLPPAGVVVWTEK